MDESLITNPLTRFYDPLKFTFYRMKQHMYISYITVDKVLVKIIQSGDITQLTLNEPKRSDPWS